MGCTAPALRRHCVGSAGQPNPANYSCELLFDKATLGERLGFGEGKTFDELCEFVFRGTTSTMHD
jgi:hypothetical protein